MTSLNEPQLQESPRKWTPGPWMVSGTVVHLEGSPYTGAITSVYGQGECTNPNAALIALGPEMAEAILAFADEYDFNSATIGDDVAATVLNVREKLRAIGGAS